MSKIPVKYINKVAMPLYDVKTGDKVLDLGAVSDIQLETNTLYKVKDKEDSCGLTNSLISGGELTFETANVDIDTLLGIDKTNMPDTYDLTHTKVVQCRRHKKKRINKKWAKRYGYKTVDVVVKGWQLSTYRDGTFEFKKELQ